MNNRPLVVTIVSWFYVAVGVISLVAHSLSLLAPGMLPGRGTTQEHSLALLSAILAIAGGAFMLRGRDWARWLCVAWMGFHVILSFWHPRSELLVHALLFAGVLYLLLRPSSAAYFREVATRSA